MLTALYLLIGYLISVLIGYLGTRRGLKKNGFDPDWLSLIFVFIPLVNVIWGVISFCDSLKIDTPDPTNKIPRKFFRL